MRLRYSLIITTIILCLSAHSQETEDNFIKDPRSKCTVWFKHTFSDDSVSWAGGCTNGFASGLGTMFGFTAGKETSKYIGEMKDGKPHGQGTFTFWKDRKLSGNFRYGEPLFLNNQLLKLWKQTIVSTTDSTNIYVGDNNEKNLFYDAIIPSDSIQGVIVLLPGTWTTTEYIFSSMSRFCELAHQNHLAVIALSINQRLTLTDDVLNIMNTMLTKAIQEYNLPKEKFILGGWSMGGIFSMRYAEFSNQDSTKTVVKPVAIFNCDGPCDLKNVYTNFKRKLNKNPSQNEPAYGMRELEKYCQGTPETAKNRYEYYSPFTCFSSDGGNAKYLLNTPLRIYGDVDPNWWMENRNVDMYDLNALDQTAMIQWLKDNGNKRAEFINAYQKGYRLEGNRHPHSWSIVEPNDCIQWILNLFNTN